ncbi:DNA topoisomerase I, mitochondrial isoform X1 [Pantherophis guttatus]|uniref:DNA topoisomerase I n=1 Tax=Pantherophis guttatus TaxID=94885 RepID=A0ABM3YNS5_PANGU|nr:DNA topoisomerase I, mitochondrial isoform X1 [Pantherophis guttatus]
MDSTLCNGHAVPYLREEPALKKTRLQSEDGARVAARGNKAATEAADGPEEEERGRKKGRICAGKVEEEGHSTQEEKRGSRTTEGLEQEDFRGTEEERNNDKQLEQNVGPGDGEDGVDRRRSEQNIEVKTEKEWEGEREVDREWTGEEIPQLGKEMEERTEDESGFRSPFEIKLEGDSEEEEGTGDQGTLQDGVEKKTKRSRSKRGVRNVEFLRGSRKRKNEEVDKTLKKKKKKKDEGNCGRRSKAEEDKWRWWEEDKRDDGVKWHKLHHKGPYFAAPYEPLPNSVKFYYNGRPMKLSRATEEVATFFAKMLDDDYARKKIFRDNFFCDWMQVMTPQERKKIKDLKRCDFSDIHSYFLEKQEAQKALPKEEKQRLKEEAERIQEKYGYCVIDGHREKIGNFKIEPPGLFRGRGNHPKMGMLKKRIMPEDVIINCSKDSKIPRPPRGHKWREVRCDNTVTWLASWTENIQGSIKYIMLNPSSKLKGEKDWQKYEVARRLKKLVHRIRRQYRADWKSKELKKRQISVALYFIDKLALRTGNEKEEGETADTVGCCSLRVEHIALHSRRGGKENVVEFDFLGKDCIRYYNEVSVEKQVFKNLQLFMEEKEPGDNLFDKLSTTMLNKHLQDLMDGLTAKVFRTYNASITLQEQLEALTNEKDSLAAKLLSYNRANRAVAVLCNHQRATPKTYEKSMKNLQAKIGARKDQLADAKVGLRKARTEHKCKKEAKSKAAVEKKKKLVKKIEEQLAKLKFQATDKEENKEIALGTSKLNYLDPRITVAWCKRFDVPIEKVYSKTQREKFAWAIAMADEDFVF